MRLASFVFALILVGGCAHSRPSPEAETSGEGCNSPLGFIPEGHSATGYLQQVESPGQLCQQGTLTCENGAWSGAYIYPSCVRTPQR